jgi:hypothetical protein
MILTPRRMNLMQAAKIFGEGRWLTIPELKAAGAYGPPPAIRRALRKMMAEGAVEADHSTRPWRWRITPLGYHLAGMVPARS